MRLRDASGNVYFDETDRLPAVIGTYSYSMGSGVKSQVISVSGVTATTHFAFDNSNNCLCLVGTNQVTVQRLRSAYTATEAGTITVYRT